MCRGAVTRPHRHGQGDVQLLLPDAAALRKERRRLEALRHGLRRGGTARPRPHRCRRPATRCRSRPARSMRRHGPPPAASAGQETVTPPRPTTSASASTISASATSPGSRIADASQETGSAGSSTLIHQCESCRDSRCTVMISTLPQKCRYKARSFAYYTELFLSEEYLPGVLCVAMTRRGRNDDQAGQQGEDQARTTATRLWKRRRRLGLLLARGMSNWTKGGEVGGACCWRRDEQLDDKEEPGGGSCWWRAEEEEGPAAGLDEQLEEEGLATGLDEQLEEASTGLQEDNNLISI